MHRRDVLAGAAGLVALGLTGCATSQSAPADATDEASLDAAFFYGFPLYEFARLSQLPTFGGVPTAGLNRIAHATKLADHTMREITAPNNDTFYSVAYLELSGGPVEVVSPTDLKRYFSIAFMDAFTDNFAYIGTRATKGQGGRFWVAGPQWSGKAPAGVTVFRSSTNDVWMLGRTLVDGAEDAAAAHALQQQMTVRPTTSAAPRAYAVKAANVQDPVNFLGLVNDMIARSPGRKGQLARAHRFASQGIGRPASPELLEAWKAYLPKTTGKLRQRIVSSGQNVNGWTFRDKGLGNFGENDAYRAAVALGGIGALEEAEAMYLSATTDSTGAPMTGANRYVWRVPPEGIPAEAFWSMTMYQAEPDGRRFLVDNPIRRYSIGDRTRGLVKNADGSLDILIQRDQPTGPLAANWLPAPAGPVQPVLRAYIPKPELINRTWKPPAIARV